MRRIVLFVPLLLLPISLLALAAPASAQADRPATDADLTLQLTLNRAGGDVVSLRDASTLSPGETFNLSRNVADVLGISGRYEARSYDEYGYETDLGDSALYGESRFLEVDGRLAQRAGDDWRLSIDGKALNGSIFDLYEVESYLLRVCTPDVPVADTSSREATLGADGCRQWLIRPTTEPVQVNLLLQPEPGKYWDMLAVTALGVMFATMLMLVLTYLIKRGLKYMRAGAITVCLAATATAMLAFAIALIPFGVLGSPVDDLVLSMDLWVTGHVAAVVVPALLCAVPFIAMAIGVVQLPPAPDVASPHQGGASYASPMPYGTPSPAQQGYAQIPAGYGWPQQGYPVQTPYPSPPGYPNQSGYPAQPAYPVQPGYPPVRPPVGGPPLPDWLTPQAGPSSPSPQARPSAAAPWSSDVPSSEAPSRNPVEEPPRHTDENGWDAPA